MDDGQILDALTFQLTNQVTTGVTISFSGSMTGAITVNSNGKSPPVATCNGGNSQTGCSADETNWTGTDTITGPANDSTIQFDFCDANITTAGCPSSSSHTYASADG